MKLIRIKGSAVGSGRTSGSTSFTLVSMADLINNIPQSTMLKVSRIQLEQLGFKTSATQIIQSAPATSLVKTESKQLSAKTIDF